MQVQTINNNDINFRAMTSIKTKGRDFDKAPELANTILKRVANNEKCQFSGESVKAVIKAIDFKYFPTMLAYGGTEDIPYSNAIRISIYKKPDGNILSRAWKNIKGFIAKYYTKKGEYSQAYREVAPYEIWGRGNSFQTAFDDAMHMLDIGATPSQHFHRGWYD